jgi:hypothetical protein
MACYAFGMAVYIIAVIIAALIQIGTIYFLRGNFMNGFPYAIPFIITAQFLFLWSYSNAPTFTIFWFIAVALTSGLAFIVGYFLWQEQLSSGTL